MLFPFLLLFFLFSCIHPDICLYGLRMDGGDTAPRAERCGGGALVRQVHKINQDLKHRDTSSGLGGSAGIRRQRWCLAATAAIG